jgi:hypothetical protein
MFSDVGFQKFGMSIVRFFFLFGVNLSSQHKHEFALQCIELFPTVAHAREDSLNKDIYIHEFRLMAHLFDLTRQPDNKPPLAHLPSRPL